MTNDEHSRRVSATLSLGLPGIPMQLDPPEPSYRNHGEEIAAVLDRSHHSMRVSDQEALQNANQHEIQTTVKW